MRDRGCSRVEASLTTANILGVCAIVIVAAAIGTDRWVMFTVDRTKAGAAPKDVTQARYYHTRHRGMFRECYPTNDTEFLQDSTDVVDKNCFQLRFIDNIATASAEYKMMLGLYTSFMSMFVIAEIIFVLAYILGLCLCVQRLHTLACFASIFSFVSAFLLALGMALFHASIYVEREQVNDRLLGRQLFYQQWPSELKLATTREFKESYIAAWCGLVLTAITAICYGLAAKFLADKKHRRRQPEKAYRDPYFYDNHQYALEPYQHPKVIPMDHNPYTMGRPAYYESPRPVMYAEDMGGYRIRELQ